MHRVLASTIALLLTAVLVPVAEATPSTVPPVPGDPLTGSGATGRTVLTADDLTGGSSNGTVTNSAFALPEQAAPPAHDFEGTLTLEDVATEGGFNAIEDPHRYGSIAELRHLPPFSARLVQNGSHLIPTERGLRYTGSPYWNLAVGVGRAWSEDGDGGQTRAALPFALIERNANCVHNGLLTFLFTDTGTSQVRYQITSETCEYFTFDMWGQVPGTYTPQDVADGDAIRTAYAEEVGARIPTRPIDRLATDHPEANIDLTAFGGGISPTAMSTFGFVYDGVNYVGACPAREGAYPYCGQLLLPSYSTAKTAFAGMAMMRLGQKYGTGVYSEAIQDHLPETAGQSKWDGVTIRNALNMATGNYDSAATDADEGGAQMLDFFLAESYTEKMNAALGFPHKEAPGGTWVYHSSDTFLATTAMDNYLAGREGSSADLFTMVRDEVLAPIGVSPDSLTTLRTDNSPEGAAFGGYGMFWTQDDIAKVADFLTSTDGAAGGTQLLHPDMLDDSMQRDPTDRGMTTTHDAPYQYNNGFWAKEFTSADSPDFSTSFWVPFMSGFGGITVAMMPNGSSYYVFSDNNEYAWKEVVAESHKLTPMTGGDGGGGDGCTATDLIDDGGFEQGPTGPWTASDSVIDDRESLQPAHSGSWKAWLNGWGYTNTETLRQTVTIPADCAAATLSLYLRIETEETLANVYDTLELAVTPSGGTASTLAQWSNLDPGDYRLQTVDLSGYAGQSITITFTGSEDYSKATDFVIDDVALAAS